MAWLVLFEVRLETMDFFERAFFGVEAEKHAEFIGARGDEINLNGKYQELWVFSGKYIGIVRNPLDYVVFCVQLAKNVGLIQEMQGDFPLIDDQTIDDPEILAAATAAENYFVFYAG